METNERLVIPTVILCSYFTYEKTEIQQVTCHRSHRRQGTDFVNQNLLIPNSVCLFFVFLLHLCMLSHFSCVWLCVILWNVVAHHASLSIGFSRQEYWSALPFPPPRDLPNPEPTSHLLLFVVQLLSHIWFWGLHGLQYARPPCPSPTPRACSNSCPWSQWCHPTISSSVISFSSCLQSFPASGSFPTSPLFTSDGQSIGASASASVLPFHLDVRNSKTSTVLVSRSFFPFL